MGAGRSVAVRWVISRGRFVLTYFFEVFDLIRSVTDATADSDVRRTHVEPTPSLECFAGDTPSLGEMFLGKELFLVCHD